MKDILKQLLDPDESAVFENTLYRFHLPNFPIVLVVSTVALEGFIVTYK